MSLEKPDLHVRVDDRVMAALKAIAKSRGNEAINKVASDMLTCSVMGEVYFLKVAAVDMVKSGILGIDGE